MDHQVEVLLGRVLRDVRVGELLGVRHGVIDIDAIVEIVLVVGCKTGGALNSLQQVRVSGKDVGTGQRTTIGRWCGVVWCG